MRIFLRTSVVFIIMLSLISCGTPEEIPGSADKLSSSPVTPIMRDRASYIKDRVFSKCSASAVFISHPVITLYSGRSPELAERCSVLGITDVFIFFDTGNASANNILPNFIASFSSRKINSWLYIDTPRLYAGADVVSACASSVNSFSGKLAADSLFRGLLIYQRPDLVCGTELKYTSKILYKWSDDSYGKGLDNDMLMKAALEIATAFRRELPPELEIMQMISPFYDRYFKKGFLDQGASSDFMKSCSKLCLAAFFSDRFQIDENIQEPLRNISVPSSVFVAVRTYVDIYGGADREKSLSAKSWFKLTKDLESILKTAHDFKSFRGIAFYDYYGLEKMWEKPESVSANED